MLSLTHIRRLSSTKALLKGLPLSFKVVNENPTNPDMPPILLLHGILSSKREWRDLGKTLSNLTKRSVATVDLRNHGNSPRSPSLSYEDMAEDLMLLLDKIAVKKVTLLGHCIGGKAAIAVALIAPQRIHSLVVVDASPVSPAAELLTVFPPLLKAMRSVDFSRESRPRLQSARKMARKALGPLANNDFLLATVLANINLTERKTKWSCNLEAVERALPRLATFPARLRARACPAPALFVGGQLSEHLPADDLPGIRACLPAACVKYLPKAGHYVHAESTARFLELTIGFLLNEGVCT